MKAIFVSVRTGSTRLPNKSILKINNKYTIEYVINSVKKSKYPSGLVCQKGQDSNITWLLDKDAGSGIKNKL